MCTPTILATFTSQNQPSHHNTPYLRKSNKKKKSTNHVHGKQTNLTRFDVYFIHKNFSHCCQQVFHINFMVGPTHSKSQESLERRKIEAPRHGHLSPNDVKKKPIKFGKVNAPFNPRVKQINDCCGV